MKEVWIGLDFDGTLVEHAFPEIGEDAGAIPWLLKAAEHWQNIRFMLVTMRSEDKLAEALAWARGRGLTIPAANVHPQQRSWTSSPKPYCQLYIDDCGLGMPMTPGRRMVDWSKAGPMLLDVLRERIGWGVTQMVARPTGTLKPDANAFKVLRDQLQLELPELGFIAKLGEQRVQERGGTWEYTLEFHPQTGGRKCAAVWVDWLEATPETLAKVIAEKVRKQLAAK